MKSILMSLWMLTLALTSMPAKASSSIKEQEKAVTVEMIGVKKKRAGKKRANDDSRQIKPPLSRAPLVKNWAPILKDTYWMVYPEHLPAFELQGNSLGTVGLPKEVPPKISALQDQTVYYIQDADPVGYFWGYVAVYLVDPYWETGSHPQKSCGTLLSPIIPDGSLILSFTTQQTPIVRQNWATGKMVWMNVDGEDQWTMNNWKVEGYNHWAYMIQTYQGHKYWEDLPLVHTSVTNFLENCTAEWQPVNPPPNPPMP